MYLNVLKYVSTDTYPSSESRYKMYNYNIIFIKIYFLSVLILLIICINTLLFTNAIKSQAIQIKNKCRPVVLVVMIFFLDINLGKKFLKKAVKPHFSQLGI